MIALAFLLPLSAACPVPFHSVRIVEGLRLAKDRMNEKNVYLVNPSFDQ